MNKTTLFVQLGRIGDILNILPLCLREFELTRIRPVLMIAAPYRPLLDGVTYVEPLVFEGDFEDILPATKIAHRIAKERNLAVVVTQIYGRGLWVAEDSSSFARESWSRLPGPGPAWGSFPLLLDRRDLTREAGVSRQLLKRSTGKPYVVLAFQGTSSPFPHYAEIAAYLRTKLREFDFVDVSGFVAPRFYDLLDVLGGAHAIVSIDSAVLHLAHGVPEVPVVAFITREPSRWHGTPWRPQQVARFFYDEAPGCAAAVVEAVREARAEPKRRIVRTFSHYREGGAPLPPDDQRRIDFAAGTWVREAREVAPRVQWQTEEFEERHARRSSGDLGDPRPVPYIRDILDRATDLRRSNDVVAFMNADVATVPGITGWILDRMDREGCAFTHRRDVRRFERPLASEAEVRREGKFYQGSDAFFFTVAWYRKHRDALPDLVLGREQCDEVLRQLIKRHGGGEIRDAIFHEKHDSFWEFPGVLAENAGNQHNRRLARRWFLRTGYAPNDWEWWALPGGSTARA